MKLRVPAVVLSAVAILATTFVAAAPAQAAPATGACTITGFSPRSVVVGLSPRTAKFKISTTGCKVDDWDLTGGKFDFYAYKDAPQETFYPWSNSDAGKYSVTVSADSHSGYHYFSREKVFRNSFSLLRRTEWQSKTFNASPEPVRKGKRIAIDGRLRIADWTNDRYVGVKSTTVSVQFKATGAKSFSTVKKVKTNSTGWVHTKVTAKKSGTWRAVYGGSTVAAAATSIGDGVKIHG